ncbi:isochorismatase family cysteine hydrolase [Pedobacter antarcticus]|uniref:cysteine hydrolase family protein n=1 Tax=Pedobacter antarcticus TaxID=34086 RepID=UPI00292F3299|nr:isochorismatase family cysteine hydrolase [Pedobacter antarcticus]
MKYILLIIDPQNDFTHINGHYATRHGIKQISEAKSKINLLAALAEIDTVIVRADYKPDQFEDGVSMAIPGTFGHEIDAEIVIPKNTIVLTKREHSCFSSNDFQNLLAELEIDTLLICGFLAEHCIKQTALDALNKGYRVILVKDCIGTGDDVQHRIRTVFAELAQQGCTVLNAADFLKVKQGIN